MVELRHRIMEPRFRSRCQRLYTPAHRRDGPMSQSESIVLSASDSTKRASMHQLVLAGVICQIQSERRAGFPSVEHLFSIRFGKIPNDAVVGVRYAVDPGGSRFLNPVEPNYESRDRMARDFS